MKICDRYGQNVGCLDLLAIQDPCKIFSKAYNFLNRLLYFQFFLAQEIQINKVKE